MVSLLRTSLTLIVAAALAACAPQAPRGGGQSGAQTTRALPPASAPARPAVACPAANALGPQYDALVGEGAFDEALFDTAVLHYTNTRRCASDLPPLSADSGLRGIASGHSADMVSQNFFGHDSPVPGRRKLTDRLKAGGVPYRAAAENLGLRSRLQLVSGRPFTIIDRPSCQFTYDGVPIRAHSYRSLAQDFVQIWEDSPEHQRNLFDARYTRLGTGARFKPNAKNCGDIIATQNFAA